LYQTKKVISCKHCGFSRSEKIEKVNKQESEQKD